MSAGDQIVQSVVVGLPGDINRNHSCAWH